VSWVEHHYFWSLFFVLSLIERWPFVHQRLFHSSIWDSIRRLVRLLRHRGRGRLSFVVDVVVVVVGVVLLVVVLVLVHTFDAVCLALFHWNIG